MRLHSEGPFDALSTLPGVHCDHAHVLLVEIPDRFRLTDRGIYGWSYLSSFFFFFFGFLRPCRVQCPNSSLSSVSSLRVWTHASNYFASSLLSRVCPLHINPPSKHLRVAIALCRRADDLEIVIASIKTFPPYSIHSCGTLLP